MCDRIVTVRYELDRLHPRVLRREEIAVPRASSPRRDALPHTRRSSVWWSAAVERRRRREKIEVHPRIPEIGDPREPRNRGSRQRDEMARLRAATSNRSRRSASRAEHPEPPREARTGTTRCTCRGRAPPRRASSEAEPTGSTGPAALPLARLERPVRHRESTACPLSVFVRSTATIRGDFREQTLVADPVRARRPW